MADLILYDLPSRGRCACWSPNPWKTRIALNFKGVPYRTEWLEYPDIAPTLKVQGVPPNDPGLSTVPYSIPTVRFDENTIVMDSDKIAVELEKRHPSPPLRLDSPIVSQVGETLRSIVVPMSGVFKPQVPRRLLNEASVPYFEQTRKERCGMPLEQFEREKGGDAAWSQAKPGFDKMAALLKRNGGPYFLGESVSYADFLLVAFLHHLKRLNEQEFKRAIDHDPAFERLYDACGTWLQRDS